MKRVWHHEKRDSQSREKTAWNHLELPLRQRLDGILLSGLLLLGAFSAISIVLGLQLFRRETGEKPEITELADRRILTNVRQNLNQQPLLDGVFHEPENRVYLSQTGGRLHLFHPDTQTWDTEKLPEQLPLKDRNLANLRSGCGETDSADCPDRDSLWALTNSGALLRKSAGKWTLISGDSAFVDHLGEPIRSEELTSAATSKDGNWLVLGTDGRGLGIYHLKQNFWLPATDLSLSSSLATRNLVFWNDLFWIGGDAGLFTLSLAGDQPQIKAVPNLGSKVRDMKLDDGQNLWVLLESGCQNLDQPCTALVRLDGTDQTPQWLISEQNVFPDLNLSRLNFVFSTEAALYLAGEAGLYAYDLKTHNWEQLASDQVSAFLPGRGSEDILWVGLKGALAVLGPQGLRRETMPESGIRTLQHGRKNEVLALTESGSVYSFNTEGRLNPIFPAQTTGLSPRQFHSVLAYGDTLLFIGEEGAMAHNVVTRTYEDIAQDLPPWAMRNNLKVLHQNDFTYLATPQGNNTRIFGLAENQPLTNSNVKLLRTFPGDLARMRPWFRGGMLTLETDPYGEIILHNKDKGTRLIGPALPELDEAVLYDAAPFLKGVMLATSEGLVYYDYEERSFGPISRSIARDLPREVVNLNGQILVASSSGRLYHANGENFATLIGGNYNLTTPADGLSDILVNNRYLFLAGEGRVDAYDPNIRRVVANWELWGSDPVTLSPLDDERVLALSGSRATVIGRTASKLVNHPLDPEMGRVLSAFTADNRIWTVRERSGTRFIQTYPLLSDSFPNDRCFFRQPDIEAGQVTDAVTLADETVAVATDSGLYFYSPASRSWYACMQDPLPDGGQLFRLGTWLLTVRSQEGRYRLSLIQEGNIRLPQDCSTDRVYFEQENFDVESYSIDAQTGELACVFPDGRVAVWQKGNFTEILAAQSAAPDPASFQKVFPGSGETPQHLLFTTSSDIHAYNLNHHNWRQIATEPGIQFENIDLAALDVEQVLALARESDGTFYLGSFDPESDNNAGLIPCYRPDPETRDWSKPILDVQQRGPDLWTFLLQDRIRYFDPSQRRWSEDILLKGASGNLSFGSVGDRGVVTNGSGSFWLAGTNGPHPRSFTGFSVIPGHSTAMDSTGQVWSLSPTGELSQYVANGEGFTLQNLHKPMLLDPATIRIALEIKDYVLFEDRQGLRVYDRANRRELPPPENFRGIQRAISAKDRLWLHNGNQLLMYSADLSETRLFDNVQSILFHNGESLWIQSGTEWSHWDGTDFIANPAFSDKQMFLIDGAPIVALNPDGRPELPLSGRLAPGPIPFGIHPRSINALFPAIADRWWVLTDKNLILLEKGSCEGSGTCLTIDKNLDLPENFRGKIVQVGTTASGDLELYGDQGLRLTVTSRLFGGFKIQMSQASPSGWLENQWPRLRNLVKTTGEGQQAFDPILGLELDGPRLLAHCQSGNLLLAANAIMETPQPVPALALNWLSWDRQQKLFTLPQTGNQPVSRILDQNRLFFEHLEAMTLDPSGLYGANRFGIWHFPKADTSLANEETAFKPMNWTSPLRGAHGLWQNTGGSFQIDGTALPETPRFRLNLGQVGFSESLTGQGLMALDSAGNQVFSARGFRWDRRRRGISHRPDGLWLQTDAGIHPLSSFGPFLRPQQSGRLVNGFKLQEGRNQYGSEDGLQWRQVDDRAGNRTLFQQSNWTWQLEQGQLRVSDRQGKPLSLYRERGRLGFARDRLIDGASGQEKIFLLTAGGISSFDQLADMERTGTDFQAVSGGTGFYQNPDRSQLLLRKAGGDLVLEKDSFLARANPESPTVLLAAVPEENPRLRYLKEGNRIFPQMKISNLEGKEQWRPFSIRNGQYPFDQVTSLATGDGGLLVGTLAGLQIYQNDSRMRMGSDSSWLALDNASNSIPEAIELVGNASDSPTKMLVRTRSRSLVLQSDGQFSENPNPGLLNQRTRVDTDFWHLTRSDRGLQGTYKVKGGGTMPVGISNGRFTHDNIQDLVTEKDQIRVLWRSGQVSSLNQGMDLRNWADLEDLGDFRPDRFIQLERAWTDEGQAIDPGLYLATARGAIRVRSKNGWEPVAADVATAVLEYDRRPAALEHKNLRILPPEKGRGFQFVYRDGGRWLPLDWGDPPLRFRGDQRLAIDQWDGFAVQGERIWTATAQGLVAWTRRQDGRIILDPDQLQIHPTPARGRNESLYITNLSLEDQHFTIRLGNDPTRVWSARMEDQPEFIPVASDPFGDISDLQAAGQNYWRWNITGNQSGETGRVSGSFGGEPISLINGRFPWDNPQSLAFYQGRLIYTTPSSGAYQADTTGQGLGAVVRPDLLQGRDQEIQKIWPGQWNNSLALGLETYEGETYRLSKEGLELVTAFPRYLTHDGLHLYERQQDKLVITTSTSQGSHTTALSGGRFDTDIISGFPISQKSGSTSYYLLPTRAGILTLNEEFRPQQLLMDQFPGLPEGARPQALLNLDNRIGYPALDGLILLGDQAAGMKDLSLVLPPGAAVSRLEYSSHGWIRARWRKEGLGGWSSTRPGLQTQTDLFTIDLSPFELFQQNRIHWGEPDPQMMVRLKDGNLELFWNLDQEPTRIPLPAGQTGLSPIIASDQLILFNGTNLWRLDLQQAMVLLGPPG